MRAVEMLEELQEKTLIVIPVPAPRQRFYGHKIRAVAERNPEWYRDFCRLYPKRRRRARRRSKPDTLIRRQLTIEGLRRLATGCCQGLYAGRLRSFIDQQLERERERERDSERSGEFVRAQLLRQLRKAPIVTLRSDPERRPGRILEKRGRKRAIVLFEGQPRPTEHAVENLEPFNLFTATAAQSQERRTNG